MSGMGIFKRNRAVFKAMAKVAIDDRLPAGTSPDLASVKAVMMEGGMTEDEAASAIEAAIQDGAIDIGEKDVASS